MNSVLNSRKKCYLFSDQTKLIIKACFDVHYNLGLGFEEKIYQRALARELQAEGLDFSREVWIDVYYKDRKIAKKRVDFIIENCLLEIKAKESFEDRDFIQTLSYLKAMKYKVALLVNFGSKKLGIKRFVN